MRIKVYLLLSLAHYFGVEQGTLQKASGLGANTLSVWKTNKRHPTAERFRRAQSTLIDLAGLPERIQRNGHRRSCEDCDQVALLRNLCSLNASASTRSRTLSGTMSSLARLSAFVSSSSTAHARLYMGRRMADCKASGRLLYSSSPARTLAICSGRCWRFSLIRNQCQYNYLQTCRLSLHLALITFAQGF